MINGIKPNIKSSTLNEVDKTKLGITFDEGIFDNFKNILHEIIRKVTGNRYNKEFASGRGAYNFLKEYSKNIKAGKSARLRTATDGTIDARWNDWA